MASNDGNSTEHELLFLIYQHLKRNGYQKAASVLRRHVAQETTTPQTSLDEIYRSWLKDAEGASVSPVKRPCQLDPVSSMKSSGEDNEEAEFPKASQTPKALSTVKPIVNQAVLKFPGVKKKGDLDAGSTDNSECKKKTPHAQEILSTPKANCVTVTGKASMTVNSEQAKTKIVHDSDSDSEWDIQPSQVPLFTPKQTTRKTPAVGKEDSDSTDSSDSEEVVLLKQVPAKGSLGKNILAKGTTVRCNQPVHSKTTYANQAIAPRKKPCSSDSGSTSDSDSSKEAPAKAVLTKGSQIKPSQPTLASKTSTGKKAESSDSESSDDTDSEEEAVAKTTFAKGTIATSVKSNLMANTKAMSTPQKSAAGTKAGSSDSGSSDDSDSEEEAPAKNILAKRTPSKPVPPNLGKITPTPKGVALGKKAESSDTESSDDLDSEEEAATKTVAMGTSANPPKPSQLISRKATGALGTSTTEQKTNISDSESSEDSDSEEEAPVKTLSAKGTPCKLNQPKLSKTTENKKEQAAKTALAKETAANPTKSSLMTSTQVMSTPQKSAAGTKAGSSDSGSSDDSDSEEEAPTKNILAKGTPSKPVPLNFSKTTPTPKGVALGKKAESSDTDSSNDLDSEEEAPAKTVAVGTSANPPKPIQLISRKATGALGTSTTEQKTNISDSESSEDSDSEEEAPVKTLSAKGTPCKPSQPKLSKTTENKKEQAAKTALAKETAANPTKSSLMTSTQAMSTPQKSAAGTKAGSSDSGSSDDSDSEEEAPAKNILAKGTPSKPVPPNFSKTTPTPKGVALGKKAESSDTESSDDSDSEEEAPVKTLSVKGTPCKPSQPKLNKTTENKKELAPVETVLAKGVPTNPSQPKLSKTTAACVVAASTPQESSEESKSSEEEVSQSLLAPKPTTQKPSSLSKKTGTEKVRKENVSLPSGDKNSTNVTSAALSKGTKSVLPTDELDSDVTDIEGDPEIQASKVYVAASKEKGTKTDSSHFPADTGLAKVPPTKRAAPVVSSNNDKAGAPLAKRKRPKDKSKNDAVKAKKKKIQSPELSKAVENIAMQPAMSTTGGDSESDSDSSLDVEKWKRLALELTDSDIAKMDAIAKMDLSSPTTSEAAKLPRKRTKTKVKEQEKNGKAKVVGKQSHGIASKTKKAASATATQKPPSTTDTESVECLSTSAKAKPGKRPLFSVTCPLYDQEIPKKRQELDKDGAKQKSTGKKDSKNKDVKDKKNKHQKEAAKLKKTAPDVNLALLSAMKPNPLPADQTKKKDRLKVEKEKTIRNTPSNTPQKSSQDTESSSLLSDSSPKKKKKSSKNK